MKKEMTAETKNDKEHVYLVRSTAYNNNDTQIAVLVKSDEDLKKLNVAAASYHYEYDKTAYSHKSVGMYWPFDDVISVDEFIKKAKDSNAAKDETIHSASKDESKEKEIANMKNKDNKISMVLLKPMELTKTLIQVDISSIDDYHRLMRFCETTPKYTVVAKLTSNQVYPDMTIDECLKNNKGISVEKIGSVDNFIRAETSGKHVLPEESNEHYDFDKEERRYLTGALLPFRKQIYSITLIPMLTPADCFYISVLLRTADGIDFPLNFPPFNRKESHMYEGMMPYKPYAFSDLK